MSLAIGQLNTLNAGVVRSQPIDQALGVERRHGGVGDNECCRSFRKPRMSSKLAQQARSDQDVVTAILQRDGYDFGG